jgi:class 3 adenylate cyclase
VNDNLIHFLRQRPELFPFRRPGDLRQFLTDALGDAADRLPVPAKIFHADEIEPRAYGFPLMKTQTLDDLETRMARWLEIELVARTDRDNSRTRRAEDALDSYAEQTKKVARNARQSSILADYHSVFWLVHTQQAAHQFAMLVRRGGEALMSREEAERLKYILHNKWVNALFDTDNAEGFERSLADNALLVAEEALGPDLRELRGYLAYLQRDYKLFRESFDLLRTQAAKLAFDDRLLRRAITLLGYPDGAPSTISLLDPRVRRLLSEHPSFTPPPEATFFEVIAPRVLEAFIVQSLRRGLVWMKTTEEGENLADDNTKVVYSRAIRPMNFGRRGVVEPIVYRYGLVYDITSFTETLGEIARGGQGEEQLAYRQMLEFQRELAEITRRHGLQFEKFLGDGAFYTSRRATRVVQAAVELQSFYANARRKGFAFNKGMRIALNYGYYRILPMQISSDGAQIMEFYGPGIVELSRLTTGKTTKELEDLQHLLISHGYDHKDVYKFFAPLQRIVDVHDVTQQQREFYAYVNENGHLINEGIVVSIPFLRQLSHELAEDAMRIYRLRTSWGVYLGFPLTTERGGYVALRILGSVSLKGIGQQEIGELVWLTLDDAEISLVDESKPLLQLLQQERNRTAARSVASTTIDKDFITADLVVCEANVHNGSEPVILVGEWDPVSEEVRRPIRLDTMEAERYGLAVPLTAEAVQSQSIAYQRLYKNLSRLETLPSFAVSAIRRNENFSGFIIGATVERL